ncbi:MAG: hypothetical protein PHQ46_03800 [Negativicutes bacterium]|nr:hypothetical protein [Negativicutes bacterium]
MAIDTLMRYLEESNKKMNIQFRQGFINKATISSHEIIDNNLLSIHIHEGHLIKIDISNFKRICFDSVVYDATNNEEMKLCLEYLRSFKRFNAYLQDENGNYILYLLFISDK